MQLSSLWPSGLALRKPDNSAVRLVIIATVSTFLIYITGKTVGFIVQLFELSSSEVQKFIRVIASLLNRRNLDLEFLPQEFADLPPSPAGVYAYAPGSYQPLLFRRCPHQPGAWQWSDDGATWLATDSFQENPHGVPEPPALIFILRLHIEHLIRRRLTSPAAGNRRLPPPLDLEALQGEGAAGGAPAGEDEGRDRAQDGAEVDAAEVGGSATGAGGGGGGRSLDAAPTVLCCPISHGLMRVPVVTPSGTTFEYDFIRRWAQQHNTDPINGSPLCEADLYPNLALRDFIERWVRQGAGAPTAAAAEGGPTHGSFTPLPPHLLDIS